VQYVHGHWRGVNDLDELVKPAISPTDKRSTDRTVGVREAGA